MTTYGRPRTYQGGKGPPRPSIGLPHGYLKEGYFDANGNTLPEVIIDWPKDIASKLYASRGIKTTQLRRFFAETRRIEAKLNSGGDFLSLKPDILKLDAYAADAVKKNKASPLFKDFIEQNLKWASKNDKAFRGGFLPHFESVVAYFPEAK